MASSSSFQIHFLQSHAFLPPSPSLNRFILTKSPSLLRFSTFLSVPSSKLQPRASAEVLGVHAEKVEDSKFVPLTADEPVYGPPAMLLLGFELEEAQKIQKLLKDLDGEFLEVIFCTEEMIHGSLWEAMHTKQTNLDAQKIAKSLPRICFLSGLSGEETLMFIDAFPEAGLEAAVFAALVPNSANKPVQELIEEIMGDHEMMTGNRSGSA